MDLMISRIKSGALIFTKDKYLSVSSVICMPRSYAFTHVSRRTIVRHCIMMC